jgi:hypothetical protein
LSYGQIGPVVILQVATTMVITAQIRSGRHAVFVGVALIGLSRKNATLTR